MNGMQCTLDKETCMPWDVLKATSDGADQTSRARQRGRTDVPMGSVHVVLVTKWDSRLSPSRTTKPGTIPVLSGTTQHMFFRVV